MIIGREMKGRAKGSLQKRRREGMVGLEEKVIVCMYEVNC